MLFYRVALNFCSSNFCDFVGFFTICKNKFLQNKITANFFSTKIYSTVEIIYKNTDLKEKMLIDNSVDNTSLQVLLKFNIVDPLIVTE